MFNFFKSKNQMKFKLFVSTMVLMFIFSSCSKNLIDIDQVNANDEAGLTTRAVTWNGASDIAVAVNIGADQNDTRKNASGPKITSNAHSADFPGIYFIWDSKQKDNGYLKVAASVFDVYESFILTSKESNTYWDFPIALQGEQEMTNDGCYVFFIPKAQNNKNINMVFVGEFILKPPVELNVTIGSIDPMAYFIYDVSWTGNTGRFDFDIEFGQVIPIDWDVVYNSYSYFEGELRADLQEAYLGLTEDKVLGWWTGGVSPTYFAGAKPVITAEEGYLDTFFKNNSDLNIIALWPELKPADPIEDPIEVEINVTFGTWRMFDGWYLPIWSGAALSKLMKVGDVITWDEIKAAYDAAVEAGYLSIECSAGFESSGSLARALPFLNKGEDFVFTQEIADEFMLHQEGYTGYLIFDPGACVPEPFIEPVNTYRLQAFTWCGVDKDWWAPIWGPTVELGTPIDWNAIYAAYAAGYLGADIITEDDVIGWNYTHTYVGDLPAGKRPEIIFTHEMFVYVAEVDEWQFTISPILKPAIIVEPIVVNLGFIGYYLNEGNVLSTSIHWQNLEEGDCIDWDAVDAAYADWVAQGGLAPKRELWQTSGFASFTFEDYEGLCFEDFNIGQLESYYKAYYVDPGYILEIPCPVCECELLGKVWDEELSACVEIEIPCPEGFVKVDGVCMPTFAEWTGRIPVQGSNNGKIVVTINGEDFEFTINAQQAGTRNFTVDGFTIQITVNDDNRVSKVYVSSTNNVPVVINGVKSLTTGTGDSQN